MQHVCTLGAMHTQHAKFWLALHCNLPITHKDNYLEKCNWSIISPEGLKLYACNLPHSYSYSRLIGYFLYSVLCRLPVSGDQLAQPISNEQKLCISKQTHSWFMHIQTNKSDCAKSSTRKTLDTTEMLCPWLSLLINIKLCYKWNGLVGWLLHWLL